MNKLWPKLSSGSPEDEYVLTQVAMVNRALSLPRIDDTRLRLCDLIVEAFRAGLEHGTKHGIALTREKILAALEVKNVGGDK
jgi:hypothetical protein